MARQWKTFVTTGGFFELAVAAPTKKAALEAWGAGPDLFQRGYAKETSDPAIVKAAMAKPGTVLQRGVGARGAFKEHADLPDVSAWEKPPRKPPPVKQPAPLKEAARKKAPVATAVADPAVEKQAARRYEAARKQREREAARAEAADRKAREQRERAIEKAESALKAAQETHDARVAGIEDERAKLDRRARDEDERWRNEKDKMEAAVGAAKA